MFLLFCFLFPHIEQKDTGKEDKDEVKMVSTCLEWDLMKTEKMDENEILEKNPKLQLRLMMVRIQGIRNSFSMD